MTAKKTTSIKAGVKPKRARSKRKIILHTPARSKPSCAEMQREKPAIRPRKRNALGAERVARIKPKNASVQNEAPGTRPTVLNKALYQNSREDFYAPWDHSCHEHAPEDTRRNYVRLQQALLVAALMLGIFDSSGLLSWVRGLPAGPIEDRIIVSVEAWHGWMEDRGLSDYLARVQKYVQSLKETDW